MKVAAKRIAAGKWGCNSGQACVSPDYVVTTKSFAPKLVVIQFQSYFFLVPTHAWSSPSIHPWLPANSNVSGLCSCSTPGVATLAAGVPEASAVRVLRGGAAAVAGPVARRQLQPLQQAHGAHGRLLGLRQCRVRRPDRRAAAVSASFTASNHALFPPVTLISSIAMPFNIIIIIIKKAFLRRAAQKDRPDAAAGRPARLRDDEGGDLRAAASHNHGTEKRREREKCHVVRSP